MTRRIFWLLGICGLLVVVSGYADHRAYVASADTNWGMIDPNSVTLKSNPIRKDWILAGHPETTSAEIAHTHDGSTQVFVWRTTAGRFNWFYEFDEVVTVLDGEMFLTDGANASPRQKERRVGPGDVVFFPMGAAVTWRVPDHVRKIATLKHPLPGPVASLARWAKTVRNWTRPASAVAAL